MSDYTKDNENMVADVDHEAVHDDQHHARSSYAQDPSLMTTTHGGQSSLLLADDDEDDAIYDEQEHHVASPWGATDGSSEYDSDETDAGADYSDEEESEDEADESDASYEEQYAHEASSSHYESDDFEDTDDEIDGDPSVDEIAALDHDDGAQSQLLMGEEEGEDEAEEDDLVEEDTTPKFTSLGLSSEVLKAIEKEGFSQPTPIQLRSIPVFLTGQDMIGQAQTGTGKTAAFALPILSKLPKRHKGIFALVLEPTRELALQVSESFNRFARYIDGFRVAPIYGGASYEQQIRNLRHGAQVVVATPGRLMDLIDKGRLDFSEVKHVVIDEADEMLRMGFIDDVDWILDQVPNEHQTALFSATMPPVIRRIAKAHLVEPEEVRIESHSATATTVRQRYWVVSGVSKIDAITRMLEVESYEGVLVFVRTKTDAEDVAHRLSLRGLACAALHGDIPQRQREKLVERLKKGSIDIIIATDVAARGLDVDRITHVFNYDIPYDAESYVHRIGRTGRAGRNGEAILFVSPRERRALRQIERVTRQRIEPMSMPTVADVNKRRLANFRKDIIETIDAGGLEDYLEVIGDILKEDIIEPQLLAAALAKMSQRDGTLLLDESVPEPKMRSFDDSERPERRRGSGGPSARAVPLRDMPDLKMLRYRLAVGRRDAVKPGQIVGAIANEANIESKYIGEISIYDTFSTVDLPEGMPRETMHILARARVCGRALELREYTAEPPARGERRRDRGDRFERSERGDRFERGDRSERRSERGDRGERRFEHGDRFERGERGDRFDRAERRHRHDDMRDEHRSKPNREERRRAERERARPNFDVKGNNRRNSSRPRPHLGGGRRGF